MEMNSIKSLPLEGSVILTPPVAEMGGMEEAGETSGASGAQHRDD